MIVVHSPRGVVPVSFDYLYIKHVGYDHSVRRIAPGDRAGYIVGLLGSKVALPLTVIALPLGVSSVMLTVCPNRLEDNRISITKLVVLTMGITLPDRKIPKSRRLKTYLSLMSGVVVTLRPGRHESEASAFGAVKL
jgi:hypothetical protein